MFQNSVAADRLAIEFDGIILDNTEVKFAYYAAKRAIDDMKLSIITLHKC